MEVDRRINLAWPLLIHTFLSTGNLKVYLHMYAHITPHESEPIAKCLGWATLSRIEICT